MRSGRCPVYFGIAGWTYPDWEGVVYPEKKVDELAYVSSFVDTIEINSTFYRPPSERNSDSWLKRTEDKQDFFFTAKLNRDFTHEGKFDPEIVKQFHKGFEPLVKAKKMRHLLAQFKWDFADSASNRKLLQRIVEAFGNTFHIVAEVRHMSWQQPQATEWLDSLGLNLCNLDYPLSSTAFTGDAADTGKDGYFRLHGRNAKSWFSKGAGRDEVYNYYYKPPELAQIGQRIDKLSESLRSLTVIGNNHYRGAELANVLELKALMTGNKVDIPAALLKTYPDLGKIAANVW
jgi:uncharacterized protein YecE (DUF72 family)